MMRRLRYVDAPRRRKTWECLHDSPLGGGSINFYVTLWAGLVLGHYTNGG